MSASYGYEGMHELLPMHRSMLMNAIAHPGSGASVRQLVFRLSGGLNVTALKQCVQDVSRVFPVFRTSFHWEGVDRPVLFVHDEVELPVEVLKGDETEQASVLNDDKNKPFDLRQIPLSRFTVAGSADSTCLFAWAYPEVLMDARSADMILSEIFSRYKAIVTGVANPGLHAYSTTAPAMPEQLPYGDQLVYWEQQLAGAPLVLELPLDKPRPAEQTGRSESLRFPVPGELSAKLKAVCEAREVGLSSGLLSAYAILLSRYARQAELLIGAAADMRSGADLVGQFTSTVALRVETGKHDTFAALLGHVAQLEAGAGAHSGVPLDAVAEKIQPEHDARYHPIFQAAFQLLPVQASDCELPLLSVHKVHEDYQAAGCDLKLTAEEGPHGLQGCISYDPAIFDPATIERISGHFINILRQVCDNPAVELSAIGLLTPPEYQTMVYDWNNTGRPIPETETILDFISAIAAAHPSRPVFEFDGEVISYGQLEKESGCVAAHLLSRGLSTGDRVGLIAHKSIRIVSAMLGIMRAGGVYVPIDPEYPQERKEYMLSDSGARFILTELPLDERVEVPVIEYSDGAIFSEAPASATNALPTVKQEDLAYIIYTSGSTGRPKGVMLRHKGLLNLVAEMAGPFRVDEHCRTLQFASLSFDTSIAEMFTSLYAGGTLVMAPKLKTLPGPDFVTLLQTAGINHITLPPSVLNALPYAELPQLTVLVAAGEACSNEIINVWGKNRIFINAYGPTECTVCAMLSDPCVPGTDIVTIGRPIGNVVIYVLDEFFNPVPPGVPGELFIGGIGVAAGYINLPAQSERFLADKFSADPAARMYRTGDLVKYLSDGRVCFIGRKDRQFKLRGFRIEPGEIETKMLEVPGVRDAAVLSRLNNAGNPTLAGFYTCDEGAHVEPDEIRTAISAQLPKHMVPSLLIKLKTMPLTYNNKIDYKWLATTKIEEQGDEDDKQQLSKVEAVLVKIFKEVLGRAKVNVSDNFFAIGGDSISAIQIVSRANAEGVMVTLKQLFREPTVYSLAQGAGTAAPVVVTEDSGTGIIPQTPVYKWFFERQFQNMSHYNQSLALTIPHDFNPEWAETALTKILGQHGMLRLRIQAGTTGYEVVVSDENEFVPIVDVELSAFAAEQQEQMLLDDMNHAQTTLDVFGGPVIAARYYNFGADKNPILFLVIHHLAVDGVSWRILVEDLVSAYSQLSAGKEATLAPVATSFKRWAESVLEYSSSDEVAAQIPYWLNERWMEAEPLPRDKAANLAVNTIEDAVTCHISLDMQTTDGLLSDAHKAYNTQINHLLMAALAMAFSGYAEGSKLLVALEGHGREATGQDLDVSRTIGWFTSVYPVMLELAGADDPGRIIRETKEYLRSVPQNGFGYGLLRYGNTEEFLKHNLAALPQPEVIFNYLGQSDLSALAKSGWAISSVPTGIEADSSEQRAYLIEINAIVANGRLNTDWTYCPMIHSEHTIQRLADGFIEALKLIVNHCLSAGGVYTPSDFLAAGMDDDKPGSAYRSI